MTVVEWSQLSAVLNDDSFWMALMINQERPYKRRWFCAVDPKTGRVVERRCVAPDWAVARGLT